MDEDTFRKLLYKLDHRTIQNLLMEDGWFLVKVAQGLVSGQADEYSSTEPESFRACNTEYHLSIYRLEDSSYTIEALHGTRFEVYLDYTKEQTLEVADLMKMPDHYRKILQL